MASAPTPVVRPRPSNLGPVVMILTLSLLCALLLWRTQSTSDSLQQVQDNQTTGLAVRNQQTQLMCAIWAAEPHTAVPAVEASAAAKACAP